MNVARFYYMIRILANNTLVANPWDTHWQWLLDNGYIESAGSSSYRLTDLGTGFMLERFQKLLELP